MNTFPLGAKNPPKHPPIASKIVQRHRDGLQLTASTLQSAFAQYNIAATSTAQIALREFSRIPTEKLLDAGFGERNLTATIAAMQGMAKDVNAAMTGLNAQEVARVLQGSAAGINRIVTEQLTMLEQLRLNDPMVELPQQLASVVIPAPKHVSQAEWVAASLLAPAIYQPGLDEEALDLRVEETASGLLTVSRGRGRPAGTTLLAEPQFRELIYLYVRLQQKLPSLQRLTEFISEQVEGNISKDTVRRYARDWFGSWEKLRDHCLAILIDQLKRK